MSTARPRTTSAAPGRVLRRPLAQRRARAAGSTRSALSRPPRHHVLRRPGRGHALPPAPRVRRRRARLPGQHRARGQPADGALTLAGGSVEDWDPFTRRGQALSRSSAGSAARSRPRFSTCPPGGSLLLCVGDEAAPARRSRRLAWRGRRRRRADRRRAGLAERPDHRLLRPVLGGQTEKDLYFYDAQRKTFQAHGLARNPWDSAVQYKTNIVDRDKFPARLRLRGHLLVPGREGRRPRFRRRSRPSSRRPDLFSVSINDREIAATPGEWWLDRAFGVYAIGDQSSPAGTRSRSRPGRSPSTSELEPVYLLGDFRLASIARGFELRPPAPLGARGLDAQGWPFYGAAVRYTKTFNVPDAAAGASYRVRLGSWLGATAEVFVGGQRAGQAAFPPFEVDLGSLAGGPGRDLGRRLRDPEEHARAVP